MLVYTIPRPKIYLPQIWSRVWQQVVCILIYHAPNVMLQTYHSHHGCPMIPTWTPLSHQHPDHNSISISSSITKSVKQSLLVVRRTWSLIMMTAVTFLSPGAGPKWMIWSWRGFCPHGPLGANVIRPSWNMPS